MKLADWQKVADERVTDAKLRLDGDERAAAYDLAGYTIECALEPGVLPYVEKNAEDIYREEEYCASCWTHDIGTLVKASGLDAARLAEANVNPAFGVNWAYAQRWSEKIRHQFMPEPDAKRLYEAVTYNVNGVLPIQIHR